MGLWDVEALTFYSQLAHRWRWCCQPYAPAALCSQENSWYSFLLQPSRPQGHSAAGRARSIERSNNNIIGKRTRDFTACSIVLQPTTLPRAPEIQLTGPIKQQNILGRTHNSYSPAIQTLMPTSLCVVRIFSSKRFFFHFCNSSQAHSNTSFLRMQISHQTQLFISERSSLHTWVRFRLFSFD
jgi:hypothetical protein